MVWSAARMANGAPPAPPGRAPASKKDGGDNSGLLLIGGMALVGTGAYFLLRPTSTATPTPTPSPSPTPTPSPTPSPTPVDAWQTWWTGASQGARSVVSVFYTLLHRPPGLPSQWTDDPPSTGVDCEAYGGLTSTLITGCAWRIISNELCEFFNDIDVPLGGPGVVCDNPGGYCSCYVYGSHDAWISAASEWILGTPYTGTVTWTGGPVCGDSGTNVADWAYVTMELLINSAAFSTLIDNLAAASAPPWGSSGGGVGYSVNNLGGLLSPYEAALHGHSSPVGVRF